MLYDALTRRADFVPDGIWTALYALWIIGSTVFVLSRRRRPQTTLAWLLAFWTLPIVSLLIYFMVGPRQLDHQSGLRRAAVRRAGEVAPAPAKELPADFLASTPFATLARVPRSGGDREPAPRRAEGYALYADGDEAYPAIRQAIEAASETVHLEYYIWQPDVIGTLLRDVLVERARAGVRVRVLVDALGAKNCAGSFWNPLAAAGAEIRKFNPPHPLKPQPGKMNFRTHRKIVVLDGRIAFTGGVNVNDDDRSDEDGSPAWRNAHLRIDGAPALDLQAIFLEDWLYGLPVMAVEEGKRDKTELVDDEADDPPLPDDIERWFPAVPEGQGPWMQIVDSGPDEPTHDIHLLYFSAITAARERLWIVTPYFVPDEEILAAIASAAARGVDVRIIVPESGDSSLVDAAAETYASEVAERGVDLYLYRPRMIHSKTMIVDDALSIIGTANMDNRSFRLNFEVVVAVFDEGFTAELAAMFEEDLAETRRFDPECESRTLPRRLYTNAVRLLAPLL